MVTLKVTSHRGHHEAMVEEAVAIDVFEKMTGKRTAALPEDYKKMIPDTFQELIGLWNDDKMGYTAFSAKDGEMELIKDANGPKEILFIAPITGG